jgi:hypothetical protein
MILRRLSVDATTRNENNEVELALFPNDRSDIPLPKLAQLQTLNILASFKDAQRDSVLPVLQYFLKDRELPKVVAETIET